MDDILSGKDEGRRATGISFSLASANGVYDLFYSFVSNCLNL